MCDMGKTFAFRLFVAGSLLLGIATNIASSWIQKMPLPYQIIIEIVICMAVIAGSRAFCSPVLARIPR